MIHPPKKEEYKLSYIAFGLILGFFIGGGLVYLYTNRQNDSLVRYNPIVYLEGFFQEESTSETGGHTESGYTGLYGSSGSDESGEAGTMGVTEPSDGQPAHTGTYESGIVNPDGEALPPNDEIVIKQNRLKQVKTYYLPAGDSGNTQSKALKQLDSLLGKRPRNNTDQNLFYVEFWESPLNYKGYRMGRNKMIVYGIEQVDFASLHIYQDEYFLRYLNDFYPLSYTSEFKPLIPISDTELIEQFQQQWP